MFCNRTTVASLSVALLGYLALTAPAQSRGASDVETTLKITDPVDVGRVISRGPYFVTVKNERFTRVFRIDARTEIRRGDSSQLQEGDLVSIRCHFDDKGVAIADSIEANVDRWDGVITKVLKDAVYIKFDAPVKGSAKVIFDSRTEFRYCAGGDLNRDCTVDDLKVGRHLETIGFDLGKNELRATRVLSIQSH